jgi:membrane fusion protein, multidrug efflux system
MNASAPANSRDRATPAPRTGKRHFRGPIGGVIAASAAIALLAGCSSSVTPAPPPKPTSVRAAVAFDGPAQAPIASTGVVAARDEMRLSFKVGGVVGRIAVQEGEVVRKGQRLAEIELAEVGAQVEQARQLADKARRDLERGERLHADQVISLEQLQDLRTQASVSQAALRAASFNLGYATIVAPRDAVVLRKLVEERELVPAGEPVLTLGARDTGYVIKASLSDREVVQVGLGDAAAVRMDAYPGREFAGTLSQIAGSADPRTGMFPVEIRLDAPPDDRPLASGLVAKLTLAPRASADRRLTHVPIAAIVEGDRDRAFVYVVEGDKAVRRAVRVAFVTNDSVALLDGLRTGETVVTDGALYLDDQELIRVVTAAQQVARLD